VHEGLRVVLLAYGCASAILTGPASAQTASAALEPPFRLAQAVNAPDWLTIRGEMRARYETLGGQFRARGSGGDQVLAFRTLALLEADTGALSFGLEVQDSRVYLDDGGTPLSASIVNPLDVLQAYARFDAADVLGFATASLTMGRQTLDIGSRRVLERVDMANVIFSYTGAYARGVREDGSELHLVAFVPTGRMPADRASLGENAISGDEEQWGRRAWGVHYRAADVLGAAFPGLWAEAYVYGLQERDAGSVDTPNRDYLQPGVRLFRAPRPGQVDLDIEASVRTGARRASSARTDQRDLDVDASLLVAAFGYTFDAPWSPRLALDYYAASGDSDPTDNRFEQFERLFGSRRTDLGNTGIHGPLTSANIEAPGARIEVRPNVRSDVRLAYKAAYLAEPRDAWIVAGLRDQSAASGRFIGHSWDFRGRTQLIAESLLLEIGASLLTQGRFARETPGAPRQGDTLFGYVSLTQSF
jgi:hypothetical protein